MRPPEKEEVLEMQDAYMDVSGRVESGTETEQFPVQPPRKAEVLEMQEQFPVKSRLTLNELSRL